MRHTAEKSATLGRNFHNSCRPSNQLGKQSEGSKAITSNQAAAVGY